MGCIYVCDICSKQEHGVRHVEHEQDEWLPPYHWEKIGVAGLKGRRADTCPECAVRVKEMIARAEANKQVPV